MQTMSSLWRRFFGGPAANASATSAGPPNTRTTSASAEPNPAAQDLECLFDVVAEQGSLPFDVAIDSLLQIAGMASAKLDRGERFPSCLPQHLFVDDSGAFSLSDADEPSQSPATQFESARDERDGIDQLATLLQFLITGSCDDDAEQFHLPTDVSPATLRSLCRIVAAAHRGHYEGIDDFTDAVSSLIVTPLRIAAAG